MDILGFLIVAFVVIVSVIGNVIEAQKKKQEEEAKRRGGSPYDDLFGDEPASPPPPQRAQPVGRAQPVQTNLAPALPQRAQPKARPRPATVASRSQRPSDGGWMSVEEADARYERRLEQRGGGSSGEGRYNPGASQPRPQPRPTPKPRPAQPAEPDRVQLKLEELRKRIAASRDAHPTGPSASSIGGASSTGATPSTMTGTAGFGVGSVGGTTGGRRRRKVNVGSIRGISRDDLARAIVLQEILGPPASMRVPQDDAAVHRLDSLGR